MSCPYFNSRYGIGVCGAALDAHIPGIDEMGCFCFKDDYNGCPIFRNCFAEKDLLRIGGDSERANPQSAAVHMNLV